MKHKTIIKLRNSRFEVMTFVSCVVEKSDAVSRLTS